MRNILYGTKYTQGRKKTRTEKKQDAIGAEIRNTSDIGRRRRCWYEVVVLVVVLASLFSSLLSRLWEQSDDTPSTMEGTEMRCR